MTTLEACELSKNFQGEHAVRNLSFQANQGEVLGLVGPNGAGKTTAMLMLVGLLDPDAGQVRLLGRNFPADAGVLRKEIGWVPQDLAFYPGLSPRENLTFFGYLYGLKGLHLEGRVNQVLEISGLTRFADQFSRTLSGGLKRRLNLALGLLHDPSVLVMDEPTAGVDSLSRSLIHEHIRRLAADGRTILLASHYIEEVVAVCDRVLVLNQGQVLFSDTVSALSDRFSPGTEIVTGPMDPETEDRLRRLAGCRIESLENRFKLTLSARDGQAPGHSAWTVGEALEILKQGNTEVLSLTASQPSLHQFTSPASPGESGAESGTPGPARPAADPRPGRLSHRAGGAVLLLLLFGVLGLLFRPEVTAPEPAASRSPTGAAQAPRLFPSPDGESAAFIGDGGIRIRLQKTGTEKPLPGTEGARGPLFWSPDSRQLVYVRGDQLWRVPASGSNPTLICALPEGTFRGGTWGPDNRLIVSMGAGGLYQVSSQGGPPELLATR